MTVTLITGGSSGIGAAVARQLLALGHQVTITGRDKSRLDAFGSDALTVVGDAAEPSAASDAVNRTVEAFGRLDNIVANAGYATHDSIGDGDRVVGWRHMVLTNVLGPAALIHYSLPALRESRGRIVLVGSLAGHVHTPGNMYGATKFAVTGLAENVRQLVAPDGIGVTLVSPGAVETAFSDPVGGLEPGLPRISADQLAATIVFALNQPPEVDLSTLIVRPVGSVR
ncbi:NADP-dependent 3-hydroxy acid dehydrogenase YdfG [Kribbella antiqua]|uniref:NADP-dependent 3-hydroxy acid dehydrogenase YdfG n=1 Tax=Kribbella antiqua TaxID=2512217 RepID=A0A4R2IS42_9ACTN|nr:SDR family NAD(P)-dependent oxidoreductase [Kribbella antiqua]TCO48223.1 NADP-dependent 3-hydroxy acid dehydrogenase YdfG [Kribbella antiqua]